MKGIQGRQRKERGGSSQKGRKFSSGVWNYGKGGIYEGGIRGGSGGTTPRKLSGKQEEGAKNGGAKGNGKPLEGSRGVGGGLMQI